MRERVELLKKASSSDFQKNPKFFKLIDELTKKKPNGKLVLQLMRELDLPVSHDQLEQMSICLQYFRNFCPDKTSGTKI